MLWRITRGAVPDKPHTVFKRPDGSLYYEHCLTRDGFEGPFTISYHRARPQAFTLETCDEPAHELVAAKRDRIRRRHFRGPPKVPEGDSITARMPLLFNDDLVVSWRAPTRSGARYFLNADGDELLFVHEGAGTLLSPYGELAVTQGSYVFVPKGVAHRFDVDGRQGWLSLEFRDRLGIPQTYRNEVGQLRMGAPYSHRDFALPEFFGIRDEGLREVVVQRDGALYSARYQDTPLDLVGYDGSLYPVAFPILAFQPRVGSVHLPPTTHATFENESVLVCSFVPRPLDFAQDAVPCPYPHSSVDVDEVLFYVAGDFTSRSGVGPGSLTWHPRGTPHGPQPGRYEASIGQTHTDEIAVMLDCKRPLSATAFTAALDDPHYERGFR
jgi:homogentisate 1,2-dioxygenase